MISLPWSSIGIIAPIVLIAIIAITVIGGIFTGWKKAAFWGGGNLLGYIIAILVYRLAGTSIAKLLAEKLIPMLTQYGKFTVDDVITLVKALTAPLIFIVIFFVWELILLINYLAWYRRVTGITREKLAKKCVKKWKKEGGNLHVDQENPKNVKYKVTMDDVTRVQSKKYKIANPIMGCLTAVTLTMPSTFAFSQGIACLTTTSSSRVDKKFVANSYNALVNFTNKASWASYYDSSFVEVTNSALAILKTMSDPIKEFNIEIYTTTIKLQNTSGVIAASTMFMAYSEVVLSTMQSVTSDDFQGLDDTNKEKIENQGKSILTTWNSMFNETNKVNPIDLQATFSSPDLITSLTPVFVKMDEDKKAQHHTFTKDDLDKMSTGNKRANAENIYNGILTGQEFTLPKFGGGTYTINFLPEGAELIKKITVPSKMKTPITNVMFKIMKHADDMEDAYLEVFKNYLGRLMDLFFDFQK